MFPLVLIFEKKVFFGPRIVAIDLRKKNDRKLNYSCLLLETPYEALFC